MAYDFNTIARTYDRLNRVMTFGLDRRWRRLGVQAAGLWHGRAARAPRVLDVACGTGDMCMELTKRGCTVTGVDLSEEMLEIAKQKTASATSHLSPLTSSTPLHFGKESKLSMRSTSVAPTFHLGNAEALPFAEGEFDAVTCAFGVRNFVHLEQGLGEMLRVLKPGGRMVILELATPDCKLLLPFYRFYTHRVIPWLGSRIAGNREAYTYLPESIERFPKGEEFLEIIQHSSFNIQHCRQRKLTFGVCRMYTVEK